MEKAFTHSVLEVSGLHKKYGAVEVLHGLSLRVAPGERVAMMGPSGCGKSTLLNCLCGIETVDGGSVRIGDYLLERATAGELERLRRETVGYVFQSFHLLPTLTAFENVEFPGQLVGWPARERRERARHLLATVGLTERAGHLPSQLSGGERQRVALARAVMHRPLLILADEPTGSLDSKAGALVLDLLERISIAEETALLVVTHDVQTTRICGRVLHMRDGRLQEGEECETS